MPRSLLGTQVLNPLCQTPAPAPAPAAQQVCGGFVEIRGTTQDWRLFVHPETGHLLTQRKSETGWRTRSRIT